MPASYLKSIRNAKLRCKPFQNPQWPLVDENGDAVKDESGAACCTYYVRVLSLGQALELNKIIEDGNKDDAWWAILSRTLCDKNGVLVLSEADRDVLAGASLEGMKVALDEASALNGLGAAAKNS